MRPKLVFVGRFAAFLLVLYAAVAIHPTNDHVIVPFTAALTKVSAAVVKPFEHGVYATGTTMMSARFGMDIKNGCNGVETMLLFAAAVLASEVPLRWRLIGLAIGLPLIQFFNIIRLVSLFWIGIHRPDWFTISHVAVWQAIMILIGVAIFAIWSARFAPRPALRR